MNEGSCAGHERHGLAHSWSQRDHRRHILEGYAKAGLEGIQRLIARNVGAAAANNNTELRLPVDLTRNAGIDWNVAVRSVDRGLSLGKDRWTPNLLATRASRLLPAAKSGSN